MDGLARAFDRRLRATRKFHQHFQRFDDGTLPHRATPDRAEAALAMNDAAITCGCGKMDKSDRFSRCRATGTCNAGDGDGDANARFFKRSERHGGCGFLAHRTERFKRRRLDAEHRALGVVGVGHKAAVDDVRRAGNFGQCAGDKSSGAGLCRCNCQFTHPAQIEQRPGQGAGRAGDHVRCSRPLSPMAGEEWRWLWQQCLPDVR
jgi:hypothetical protein